MRQGSGRHSFCLVGVNQHRSSRPPRCRELFKIADHLGFHLLGRYRCQNRVLGISGPRNHQHWTTRTQLCHAHTLGIDQVDASAQIEAVDNRDGIPGLSDTAFADVDRPAQWTVASRRPDQAAMNPSESSHSRSAMASKRGVS